MKFILILLLGSAAILHSANANTNADAQADAHNDAVVQPNPAEGRIIADCLKSYGGLTAENAQRLQRFKHWSETYEEIPCFSQCYLSNMFDIYDEKLGFQEQAVVQQFGQPLYNACRHRMAPATNSCETAYHGFHCIVNLENDPFVIIESMKNLTTDAKTAMKDCLRRFDQYEWEHIKEYTTFPVREPIPCFTKCFIDRLQLFNPGTHQWNLPVMRTKLGVPSAPAANVRHCQERRRSRNSCIWMYQEFTCFTLAKA